MRAVVLRLVCLVIVIGGGARCAGGSLSSPDKCVCRCGYSNPDRVLNLPLAQCTVDACRQRYADCLGQAVHVEAAAVSSIRSSNTESPALTVMHFVSVSATLLFAFML